MKQQDFIDNRKSSWLQFEQALLQQQGDHSDLPKMYRQLCHDIATAKARHYSPEVIDKLNNLLLTGQAQMYKPKNRLFSSMFEFVIHDFRQSIIDIRRYVVIAHALFYGTALLIMALVCFMPSSASYFVAPEMLFNIEKMYDPTSEFYAKERASDSDFLMFGHYIKNNISIAFQCFVGGILLGLGTLFFLIYNAIYFGAIMGHIINIEYQSTFFSFVITHGSFELSAIVLSAAAGGVIARHFIAPGNHTRVESLKLAGKRTFPVIIGCFILLLLAAFVEAFWSSSQTLPNIIKYVVGGACWLWMLWFMFWRK